MDYSRKIQALAESDQKHLWHPFTQMKEWCEDSPLIIERGEGNYLIDIEGRRYLDGVSSIWCNVHGHRKRELDEALKAQVDRIAHSTLLGLANVPSIELAERIVAIAPAGLTRVFYSDNGSTAVEVALKMAFQYWQQTGTDANRRKTRFVSFYNAYHGDTIGAVSVGGIDLFHAMYQPLLFSTFKVASSYCYRCPFDTTYAKCSANGRMACVDAVEDVLRENHEEIAGLIIEPLIQAAAGMLTSPPGYLKAVRELCTKYNVLMIADEVATGFGKTGAMFACDREGVAPDLMAVSKGITGGYMPLAVTLATESIYEAFLGEYEEFKTFFHGHTYTGNPLGCAVALANLDLFENERLLEGLQPKIALFTELLGQLEGHPHVGEVRQCGVMVGIELVRGRASKGPWPLTDRIGHRVCMEMRKDGIILRPLGNVVVMMPPLSIAENELKWMVEAAERAINVVCGR